MQFSIETNKKIFAEIVDRQIALISALGYDMIYHKALEIIRESCIDDKLRVVVLGYYGCGKSSFLNALFGLVLLPMKLLSFDLIWEVHYSDTATVTLFPKNGAKRPFNISFDDLGNYLSESIEEYNNNKCILYKKIVINYPIELRYKEMVFLDIPGNFEAKNILNDISTEDSIIYCMNAGRAFSAFDKTVIENLRAFGYNSIIFVLTFYDNLEINDELLGSNDAELTRKYYTEILAKYTDLGSNGIFFVGSLQMLKGKKNGDNEILKSYDMPRFNKVLEQILYRKERRKLIDAIISIKKINNEVAQRLSNHLDVHISQILKDNSFQWSEIEDQLKLSKDLFMKNSAISTEFDEIIYNLA